MSSPRGALAALGRWTLGGVRELRSFGGMFRETLAGALPGPLGRHPIRWRSALEQARLAGYDSLPIVMLIALLIGIILSVQAAYQLRRVGAVSLVADLVAVTMLRELGPLMTAIIVTGRSGSAIAAEISSMTVSEEVDALRVMGFHPVRFLVVPRFLALVAMMPCLTAIAILVGLAGGLFTSVSTLEMSARSYIAHTRDAIELRDLFICLLKAGTFGAIVSAVGSYRGLMARGGAVGVGRSTTAAVVVTIITIIAVDMIFAGLFYFGR